MLRTLRPLPCAWLALALFTTMPAYAQAPADPPAQTAPEAVPSPGPDGGAEMKAPPVVDPKGVDTQPIQPAPAPGQADSAGQSPLDKPDGFGEEIEMRPSPVLQKRAQSGWDEGFETIVATLKEIGAELDRLNLNPSGPPLVVYTATDDAGFDFEAAIPFAGATTEKPNAAFEFSASPAGKALRFTHRGSFDAMDPTYEQIANLLDAKDLEAQDLYIEEYRSDPRTTAPDDLVIDILVPLK